MKISKLISAIFSKWFFALLGIVILSGLLLYVRMPGDLYEKLLDFVSNLLQQKYGSGGNKVKIDTGFHKLGLLVMALGVLLFTYFSFWKWFISSASAYTQSPEINKGLSLDKKDWITISGLLLVALLLRVFPMTQSLWQDEIGVYNTFIKDGFLSTIFPKSSMGSQPLMQLLVGVFVKFAGTSEIILRLPILMFALAGIAFIYYFTLQLSANRLAAFIAAFFLTIHSYHIYYSFQMRGYVLLVFMCMLSCYILIKLIQTPSSKIAFWYTVVNVCFVYTHLYSVYLLIAQHLVVIGFHLYATRIAKNSTFTFSGPFLAIYFHAFIASMLGILLLYLPQLPVIFMNILDTANSTKSLFDYFTQVLDALHFMLAYSELKVLSSILILLFIIGLWGLVKKGNTLMLVIGMAIWLFIITAFVPSGPGFFPRYLICEIPLLLFLFSLVIAECWQSSKAFLKVVAASLFVGFCAINISGYTLSYQTVQDYKGAVNYVQNKPSTLPKLVAANSLGKTEIKFYDPSIIALNQVSELDSLMKLPIDLYVITTYESFAGKSLFINDKPTQQRIESEFSREKVFVGEFPVTVWHYEKHKG